MWIGYPLVTDLINVWAQARKGLREHLLLTLSNYIAAAIGSIQFERCAFGIT
jgi:hypothetical protein